MQPPETGSFHAFVQRVLDALAAADITYLIGGAVALAAWGDPRTTRDLDLVIELPFESMAALSAELAQRGMLVPVENMVDLMIEHRADLPLNAIDMNSGYKAEFFLLKPGDAFRASSLARRQLVDLGPPLGEVYVHAPEDLILNKLHYYQISQQPKHVRDIAGIVLNLGPQLEYDYIDLWAQSLGLLDTWQEIQRHIAKPDN
ncbi:MAG: hypothetical protein J5I90_19185 [Caldilineales bacterium]|nr:hypothetical protein [Caldilineales bacterium]